jgi:hypothetical protein
MVILKGGNRRGGGRRIGGIGIGIEGRKVMEVAEVGGIGMKGVGTEGIVMVDKGTDVMVMSVIGGTTGGVCVRVRVRYHLRVSHRWRMGCRQCNRP